MSQSERLGMDAAIARARAYYGSETDPLSLFGRLKEGYGLRDTAIQNALNARGMWRSGETGFGLNQSRLTYLRDELDYRMKLEDYINGLLATFAKSEQERQMSLIDWAWRLAQAQAASGTGGSGGGGHGGGGGGGGGGGTTAPPQSGTAPAAASTFVPYALQLARGTFGGGGGTAGAGYQPL
jgi:hypothetical protein